ncbi:MAG: ribosome maturation factor RimM [Acidimicrobiales bacterium]|nr:ribosome maturation factor RimM [Acidimicrobiales bacterium]
MLLEVGRIDKPHGLRGEVVVRFTTNNLDRVKPGARLESEQGTLVVVAARRHNERWIVRFEGFADRNAAEALRGLVLRAEPGPRGDELWVHELIGSTVVEVDGTVRGTVIAVVDNPASDLLELDSGALVPLTFVTDQTRPGRIVVDVPAGLFDDAEDEPKDDRPRRRASS